MKSTYRFTLLLCMLLITAPSVMSQITFTESRYFYSLRAEESISPRISTHFTLTSDFNPALSFGVVLLPFTGRLTQYLVTDHGYRTDRDIIWHRIEYGARYYFGNGLAVGIGTGPSISFTFTQ